jgi:hypothetical protein
MAVLIGKISIEGGPLQDFLAQTVDAPSPPNQPPMVTPPIYWPPGSWWGDPGYGKPTPPPGYPPHPAFPISGPGVPTLPVDPGWGVGPPPVIPPGETPPDGSWCWVYDDDLGWVLKPPGGGGKPQPVP